MTRRRALAAIRRAGPYKVDSHRNGWLTVVSEWPGWEQDDAGPPCDLDRRLLAEAIQVLLDDAMRLRESEVQP